MASLLPLYPEGDALALYTEMEEKGQRDVDQIEARLKEAFTDDAFSARRRLCFLLSTPACSPFFLSVGNKVLCLSLMKIEAEAFPPPPYRGPVEANSPPLVQLLLSWGRPASAAVWRHPCLGRPASAAVWRHPCLGRSASAAVWRHPPCFGCPFSCQQDIPDGIRSSGQNFCPNI
ncbi:unnamed protein product [Acanthosepion pharaonis]|uniref:Uncharacterized protein n=1 Tax=Acanthosepion pharaonis TaxID=158019 RepID=A0A812C625_ACAPH|nr:unnamed protein product [Sepia pharaonis]